MVVYSCHDDSMARYNLTEPIPLHVEHVAFEFVVEPFRPSGPQSLNYEDIRPVMPC